MYKAERSNVKEYLSLSNRSIESGICDWVDKPAHYKGYKFAKLSYNDSPLVIIGNTCVLNTKTNEPSYFVCCAIAEEAKYHLRALLMAGKDYLDWLGNTEPVMAMAIKDNSVLCSFLEHFGFEKQKYVEKNRENGIIYNVYIRRK